MQWRLYNSKDYGVPQNRERIYIVGRLGKGGGGELLPIARKSERTLKKVINGAQANRVYEEESETRAVLTPDRLKKRQNGRRIKEPGEPMFTLTGQDRHGVLIKNATKAGALLAMPGDGIDISYPNSNTRKGRVQKESCNTIKTQGQLGVLMESYPTVRIRKLTPKECWRLQGFTDEQFEKAAAVNSNTQLYKQAGNAVTVNVAEAIGRHIVSIIQEDKE